MDSCCISDESQRKRWRQFCIVFLVVLLGTTRLAATDSIRATSPDGRNLIELRTANGENRELQYRVERDNKTLVAWSSVGPQLSIGRDLITELSLTNVQRRVVDETFEFAWGKSRRVRNHCNEVKVTLATKNDICWEVYLRAYDDGVALRYRLPKPDASINRDVLGEYTQVTVQGDPVVLFNSLGSFTTGHESSYQRCSFSTIPASKLIDMPMVLSWKQGVAMAITEAKVLSFAGGYLERSSKDRSSLRWRLSPHPKHQGIKVTGDDDRVSPWRVFMLADSAGKLLESNLLICLNDPPREDFKWLQPGKTTWHWWYGEFEQDYLLPPESIESLARHRKYIDFCAEHGIEFHSVSGDGRAWYVQSPTGYGRPADDADVTKARASIRLPEIIAYAREKGVGIRLWVHWKPLSENLEAAFSEYESWGVKGLMVDFLDRDDQEMIELCERILKAAARHHLHIQFHGSSKYSGEQRTYPHLVNREGVLNLEYLKWSDSCGPDHTVNVAYARGLAGPVDYHLGGFRSVPRSEFVPRNDAPFVLGTRCHHLALYVILENPLPMVCDSPEAYEGQIGFGFVCSVPTTWDETRFVAGDLGDYIVLARRKGTTWYLGAITNWSPREIEIDVSTLTGSSTNSIESYVDGSLDEAFPNRVNYERIELNNRSWTVELAPGGGCVGIVRANHR